MTLNKLDMNFFWEKYVRILKIRDLRELIFLENKPFFQGKELLFKNFYVNKRFQFRIIAEKYAVELTIQLPIKSI